MKGLGLKHNESYYNEKWLVSSLSNLKCYRVFQKITGNECYYALLITFQLGVFPTFKVLEILVPKFETNAVKELMKEGLL